jgi:prepilin peptidase CpaA
MNNPFGSVARHGSIRELGSDDRGLSTVEYVIILVLIAVAAISIWTKFGHAIVLKVDSSAKTISTIGDQNQSY